MFLDRRLSGLDQRLGLRRTGLAAGALAGGLYTLESAGHMVVRSGSDIVLVGGLLAGIGAAIGWLAGALIRLTIIREDDEETGRLAEPVIEQPADLQGVRDREEPDTERASK